MATLDQPSRAAHTKGKAPLVSVIVPVFNAGEWIDAAIESVLAQTFTDWELFLVDDGSTDGKDANYFRRTYRHDDRICVLKTDGRAGTAVARNLGINAATGRYIGFLDADDLWAPEKIQLQVGAMEREGAVLSCTAYERINVTKNSVSVVGVPYKITRSEMLKTNLIACSTAMYDREHFSAHRMPLMRSRQDFAFWLELMEGDVDVLGIQVTLMTYRVLPQSLSSHKIRAASATWHMYRSHFRMPFLKTLWYFGNYAVRGLLRHRAPSLARLLGWMHDVPVNAQTARINLIDHGP